MKRCAILLSLILVVFSYSCAKPLYTVVQNDSFAIRNTDTETAKIVFLRPAEGLLSAYHIGIYDENELIGILPSLSCFTYNAQPGKHIFGALYFFRTDFLEADIEAGKTYYVLCGLYDSFFGGTHCKMTAIKKGSANRPKVAGWLRKLRRTELSDQGIEYYKVRSDEKGKFLVSRQGIFTHRLDIEEIRNAWLEKAKTTEKPSLSVEDGEETREIIGDRKSTEKKHRYGKRTYTAQEDSFKSSRTQQTTGKMPYHLPAAGRIVSIEDIPSGQLTDTQIITLFSNKIVKGTHRRRGFSFERHFGLDGFLIEHSPQRGEHSGYWRTNQDCLCIRWKNGNEKCGKIIKENGKINQYHVKRSGSKVWVITYEKFASIKDDS